MAAAQGIRHRLLLHQSAPAGIQQDDPRLHLRHGLGIDNLRRLREQGAVQADHVGLVQERVQAHIGADLPACVALRAAVGQHLHAQRPGDAPHLSADAAKADDAHGLTGQLRQRALPVAPLRPILPLALVDGAVMLRHMIADLQQQRNGELRHRVRAVARHIGHRHALLPGVVHVHQIISGGEDGDIPHVGAGVQHLPADGRLVGHDDLRIADVPGDLRRVVLRHAVIYGQLTQCPQRVPAQVAGVFHIGVQNNDLHCSRSFRSRTADYSTPRAKF